MQIKSDKIQYAKLGISQSIFESAEKIIKSNSLSDIELKSSARTVTASARVKTDNTYYKSVVHFNNDGYVRSYKCNCESSFIWKGACVHTAALFLHCLEKKHMMESELKAIESAKKIVRHFEKTTMSEIDDEITADTTSSDEKIHLSPIFYLDQDNFPYITLTIGKKRMYVVKNIKELLTNIQHKRDYSYGKDLEFNHALANFDEESIKFIDFIRAYLDMSETAITRVSTSKFYYRADDSGSKLLYIYKKGLDEFFNLFEGKTIVSNIGAGKENILFSSQTPDLNMSLAGNLRRIELTCNIPGIRKLEGAKFNYLLLNNEMYQVEKKYTSFIWPLLTEIYKNPKKNLIFENKEAVSFLSYILPNIRKYMLVKDLDTFMESLKIYDLVKKLYVDVDKNSISCKLLFCYGENEIPYSKKTSFRDGFRDAVGEYKMVHMLKSMGFEDGAEDDVLELSDDDKIYNFYYQGIEQLKDDVEIYVSDDFKRKIFKPSNKTKLGVRIKGELLEVSMEAMDYGVSELMDIIRSFNYKKKYHKLKDGRFVDLEDDSIQAAAQMMSGLSITAKEMENGVATIPKYRALYLDGIANENTIDITCDKAFKRLTNDFKNYRDLEFEIPESLDKILRPYQKTGFNWLKVLSYYGFGGILADDMGLGKTLQVISVILSENALNTGPSLVVAPTSLIYNWESEINKFAPNLVTEVISGLPARRKEIIDTIGVADSDVYITTYDMLKRDIENYTDKNFRYIIADEAQNIKNPLTQNARSIKLLSSDIKFALTGTPIENSLSELWSIFDFIMPGYLFSSAKFTKHYETPIVKNDSTEMATELRKQISPFILRRIKKDVLKELPEKIETTLAAEMTNEQRKIYAAHLLQAKGELDAYIDEGLSKNQIKIIALLTRLRQICCHPSLFVDNYVGGSGKLDLTIETITSAIESEHRIILFSQFTSMLSIIKSALQKEGIKYFYLDGQTPSRERLEMCERFNNGENEAFLISLKAGGTGLNLTGADIVIHYDPWWNPAVMDQASDRAHRFGQKNMVQVINLVAKDSIEEKIMQLQQKKKDLVDAVIHEGASFINKMTIDEVRDLFALETAISIGEAKTNRS